MCKVSYRKFGMTHISSREDGGENVLVDVKRAGIQAADYQRDIDNRHVDRLVAKYDPRARRDPVLSLREGVLWVVDGNHSVHASLAFNADKTNVPVNAVLHTNLSYEDEANLFYMLNNSRKRMKTWDEFRAALKGGNPAHARIMQVIQASGLSTPLTTNNSNAELRSTRVLYEAFGTQSKGGTERHLADFLKVLRQGWVETGKLQLQARTVEMQRGLNMFMLSHDRPATSVIIKTLKQPQNSAAAVNSRALDFAKECSKFRADAKQVQDTLREMFNMPLVRMRAAA